MKSTHMFVFLLFILTAFSGLLATSTTIDFETGDTGSGWAWTVAENASNPAMTFPANPVSGGINTSATVAEFTALSAGNPWALCFTDDIDGFTFNENNCTVTIQVYKPVATNIGIKFEGSSPAVELQVANTLINEWETVTFDFSGSIGNTYTRLVIIPDFLTRSEDHTIYMDNIVIPAGNTFFPDPGAPDVAAPVPTEDSEDVIAIYSDSYTCLEGSNFAAPWGQSTVVSFDDVEGNEYMYYASFNYQGTQLLGVHNLSGMTHVHIDLWTPDATVINFTPISASTGEFAYSLTPLNQDAWNSYDIPLSSFTGVAMTDIHQLKFDGQPGVSPSNVYIDNIYFYAGDISGTDATLSDLRIDDVTVDGFASNVYTYDVELPEGTTTVPTVTATPNDVNASHVVNAATALPGTTTVVVTAEDETTTLTYYVNFTVENNDPTEPTAAAPTPTHLHENVTSVFSNVYGDMAGANFNPSWGQTTTVGFVLVGGDVTLQYANFNYQGTEFPTINLSAMEYIHFDLWTADATVIEFSPISVSTGEHLLALNPLDQGTWNSYDIPVGDFTGVSMSDIYQLKFNGQNGVFPSTVWIDNIFFWKSAPGDDEDATLSNLLVNGSTVAGFSPAVLTYDVELPFGTTQVPTVTAVTTDLDASYVVNNAAGLPGTTTVVTTSENLENSLTYTLNFTVAEETSDPTEGAPVPTHALEDVRSIFSNTYGDLAGCNFNPYWGQSTTVTFESIGGNTTLKYANFNYQGTQFGDEIDLSLMEYVHIDIWTSDATIVKFSPISASTGEVLIILSPLEQNTWNSIDIPLGDFFGMTMSDIHQLKFDGQQGVSPSTIWLDNIYFWKNPTQAGSDATLSDLRVDDATIPGFASGTLTYTYELPMGTTVVPTVTATTTDENADYVINDATELPGATTVVVTAQDETTQLTYTINFTIADPVPTTAAPIPTVDPADVISIFSNTYGDIAGANFNPSWGQTTTVTFELIEGNTTLKYANFNYQGTEFMQTDFSAMDYVHIDIWTPDATVVKFSPISATTGEHLVELSPLVQGTWNSIDIPLSDFTGVSMADLFQLKFDGQQGVFPSTVYIDNIYFYQASAGLDTPQNVVIDLTATDVTITWSAVDGANSYKIYACDTPYGTFEEVTDGTFNGTSWTRAIDASMKYFHVIATDAGGFSTE